MVTVATNLDYLTQQQWQKNKTSTSSQSYWVSVSNMLSTVDHGSKIDGGEIKVLPPFSFPFFLGSTLPCTCSSSSSSVHLAYIYRVHKCNNNPLNAPCGHWAGKQTLDFTSKIEPTRGNLNKNSLLAHITDDQKRNNGTHKGHTCGCREPTIVCN